MRCFGRDVDALDNLIKEPNSKEKKVSKMNYTYKSEIQQLSKLRERMLDMTEVDRFRYNQIELLH